MEATDPGLPAAADAAVPAERRRRGGGGVLVLVVRVLCLATAAPVLDRLWQIAVAQFGLADETPSYDQVWLVLNALPELRIQLAVLAVLAAVVAAAFGRRATAAVAAACAVVNLGVI